MFALVVESNKAAREAIVRHLQTAQYRVEQAADVNGANACLQRERPDVVVLAWNSAAPGLIQRVRALDTSNHCYVLALLDGQSVSEVPRLYAAGADDFARQPVSREELIGRLDAPRRIRAWFKAGATLDWTQTLDLRKLRVWGEMGAVIVEDFATILGPLDVVESGLIEGEVRAASIPLSLAKEEIELRVFVALEYAHLRRFGAHVLGDPEAPDDLLEDMLRELANTAGGAVKRVALLEQVAVTVGLPVSETRVTAQTGEHARCWVATLRGSDARIALVGEIITRKNRRVSAAALEEGMVLAHDLRNQSGALVLAAGTRLTSTAAERVASLFGDRFVVEVACAA
jgi:CheY-like chemotaxis protein